MSRHRLIARIDVKPPRAVKGVRLEGLRDIGVPLPELCERYAAVADELVLVDVVASLYGQQPDWAVLEAALAHAQIPVVYVGGVRSVEDARQALRSGADRVGVNTAALERPDLLRELCHAFACSTIVLAADVGQDGNCYTNGGRERSQRMLRGWLREAADLGLGEAYVTDISRDGSMAGLDATLMWFADAPYPVTYGGGFRDWKCARAAFNAGISAVSIGTALHRGLDLNGLRARLRNEGFAVRRAA